MTTGCGYWLDIVCYTDSWSIISWIIVIIMECVWSSRLRVQHGEVGPGGIVVNFRRRGKYLIKILSSVGCWNWFWKYLSPVMW